MWRSTLNTAGLRPGLPMLADEVGRAHATLDAVLAGVHEPAVHGRMADSAPRMVVDPVAEMDVHYDAMTGALIAGTEHCVTGIADVLARILILDETTPRSGSRRVAHFFASQLVPLQAAALRACASFLAQMSRPEALAVPLATLIRQACARPLLVGDAYVVLCALCTHAPSVHAAVVDARLHVQLIDAAIAALLRAPAVLDESKRIRTDPRRRGQKPKASAVPAADEPRDDTDREFLPWLVSAFRTCETQRQCAPSQRRTLMDALHRAASAPRTDACVPALALASVVLGAQPAYAPGDEEVALFCSALRTVLARGCPLHRCAVRAVCAELDVLVRPRRACRYAVQSAALPEVAPARQYASDHAPLQPSVAHLPVDTSVPRLFAASAEPIPARVSVAPSVAVSEPIALLNRAVDDAPSESDSLPDIVG